MSKLWKFRQKSGEHLVQIDTTQSKVGKAGLYSQTQNQSYEQDTEKRSLTKAHMDRNSKKKKKTKWKDHIYKYNLRLSSVRHGWYDNGNTVCSADSLKNKNLNES